MQDLVDMIMVLIMETIITHILRICVKRILPLMPSGTTNITPAINSNSSILPEVLAIIRRIEPVFIPAVVPAMTGAF